MPPFTLGHHTFPRKTDAVTYIQSVLRGAELGQVITDPLVHALLDTHPNREDKVGRGVTAIEVHPNDWGQRAFTVRTDDGELIQFSYRECFKPSTDAQNAKAALRVEAWPQIIAFRQTVPMVCQLTGVTLTNARGRVNTAEVDHAPPATFDALAERWAAAQGGWDKVVNHQVEQRRYLTRPEQRDDWLRFHQENATLRLLSARAHRNVGGGA